MGAQPPSPSPPRPWPVPGVGSHRCHARRAGTLRTMLTRAKPCQRTGSCSPCRAQLGLRLEGTEPSRPGGAGAWGRDTVAPRNQGVKDFIWLVTDGTK